MKYNTYKKIWYMPEVDNNPKFIKDSNGDMDYQSKLTNGISTRVTLIKNSFRSKDTKNKVSQRVLYYDKSRISAIEKGKLPKGYTSFLTGEISKSIIEVAQNEEVYERAPEYNSHLPKEINEFWLLFGGNDDILKFLEYVYFTLCEDLLILSNQNRRDKQKDEQRNIANLPPITKAIQNLLYIDAAFSLTQGKLKIEDSKNIGYIMEPYRDNKEERKELVNAILYTWHLISDDVLLSFEKKFKSIINLNKNVYNSKNINRDIKLWYQEELLLVLKSKKEELKKDRIANIGYIVHDLMETLLEKQAEDKNYKPNKYDSNLKLPFEKSDKYLIDCAEKLTKAQQDYLQRIYKYEYEESQVPTAEEIKDYELYQDTILMSGSGKTFEELVEEAKKNKNSK